jgi:hypothetical protein
MVNYNCKTMHILVTLGLLVKKPLDRSLIPQYQFNKTKQHKNNEMSKSKSNMLSSMCVLFYSSFVCISAFANVSFQTTLNQHSCVRGPLRECGSIQSGASGLPYYCAPLACVSEVIEFLAVWWHNKPKTKNRCRPVTGSVTGAKRVNGRALTGPVTGAKRVHMMKYSKYSPQSGDCVTHYNKLQHTAKHCNTPPRTTPHWDMVWQTATNSNILQSTAPRYIALYHTEI